jgi:GntR family transcriptional regulator/MocR family aminotransferase
LREHIRRGRLLAGVKLPSSRVLSRQLGVSRGVVVEAYSQLTAEGYLLAGQGAPTRVASTAATERPPVPAATLLASRRYDFDPDLPDLSAFPREQWLRSIRVALREAPFAALGSLDSRGTPELRNELMAYLGRVRGAAPEPEHTLVCGGFADGFSALCRVLRARGLERIAVEAPGWPAHGLCAAGAGLTPVSIEVDGLGIDVERLAAAGCEVVVVTPSHQYPTGVVLAPERRAELVEWAEDEDALIVENDYDSELRYDRMGVGALQGLAPERVCQIGSTSVRLAPALRLGWLLSPSWLTGALTYELAVSSGPPSTLDQLALTDFLRRGELDRHLRRMRARYRSRREALLTALTRDLPAARIAGVPAGTFSLVTLPAGVSDEAIVSRAAAAGVAIRFAEPPADALVLGYANLAESAIHRGIGLLADALDARR